MKVNKRLFIEIFHHHRLRNIRCPLQVCLYTELKTSRVLRKLPSSIRPTRLLSATGMVSINRKLRHDSFVCLCTHRNFDKIAFLNWRPLRLTSMDALKPKFIRVSLALSFQGLGSYSRQIAPWSDYGIEDVALDQ